MEEILQHLKPHNMEPGFAVALLLAGGVLRGGRVQALRMLEHVSRDRGEAVYLGSVCSLPFNSDHHASNFTRRNLQPLSIGHNASEFLNHASL